MKKIFIITMLLTASFTSYSANLTEITPDHAYPGETLTVTITGAGTHFMQASQTTVRLSNYSSSPTTIYPNSIDIISDEMLNAEFSIPTNFDYYSDGFYDVRVYTDIDGYMYLYDGFYITTPEILSIFPGTGDAGQTVPVTVTGQYTHFSDAGNNIVWLYNSQGSPSTIYGTNTSVQNNTTLQTEFSLPLDAHSGYWYLRIQNDIDGTISKSNAFDINGAEIVTISPDNANIGETIQVSITGSNTHFEQSTGLAVSLTNFQGSSTTIYGSGINITDDTFLETEFTIPINWGGYSGSGYCDVRVSNSIDGNITSGDGFYIHGSEILSITPNSAVAGDILQVTIAGQNTHFSDAGNNTVWLYNYQGSTTTIYGTNTSAQSNTALQTWFSIPFDAYSGSWHLKIQNDINGTISKSYAFDISGPEITGISPASANAGEPVQVSITGQNTYFEQSGGTTVWLSSYQASSTTIYGSNINIINDFSLETTFDIPISASVGYWNLNVANSIIGTLTETYAFYITALSPELVAIYPDHADAGESLQVTITGQYTNFTQSSGTTVRLSNYQASPTYLYGTNINIVDNETIEANLSIPVTWVDHDYCDVRIYTDNYGYLYLYSGFQVNMPEIISLSADSAGA
ncbi:MAG: hypothetical protein KJ607_06125, partial [Bacteroidetes bacterium]|nr:hypothetical protein [Bacteroidota bacterium]